MKTETNRSDHLTLDELAEFVDGTEALLKKHNITLHGLGKALGYRTPTHLNRVLRLEGGTERSKLERLRTLMEADKAGEFSEILRALKRRSQKTPDRKSPAQPPVGGSSGKYALDRPIRVVDGEISLDECSFLNGRRVTEEQGDLARQIMKDLLKRLVGKGKPFRFKRHMGEAMGYVGSGWSEIVRNRANPTAWKFVRLLALKNAVEEHGENAALWFLPDGPVGMGKAIPFEYLKPGQAGLEYGITTTTEEPEEEPKAEEPTSLDAREQPVVQQVPETGMVAKPSPIPVRSMNWMQAVAHVESVLKALERIGEAIQKNADEVERSISAERMPGMLKKSMAEVQSQVRALNDSYQEQFETLRNYLGAE